MTQKQMTVKDIAERLKLHHTTVSKALRNHPDISRDTKELVMFTAKEMDYHPNWIAKSLKSRRSNTIGVIVPSIENDFYASVISGIEDVAYGQDYSITVSQSNELYEREVLNVRNLISNLVSGLIVCISQTTQAGDHFFALKKRNIPLVFFDRVWEKIEASKVVVDDYQGAFEVVKYLVNSGYKSIAHFAGPQNISVSRDRYKGYVDGLSYYNIPFDKEMVLFCGFQEIDGVRSFQILYKNKKVKLLPEAIFTVNDLVATGVYEEINKLDLKIPQNIAVVGFGNNKLSSYLNPPLTTVQQSPFHIGKRAAQIILKQITSNDLVNKPEIEIIKPELIIRQSA